MAVVSKEELFALKGKDIGTSEWMLVDQDRVNKFAEATGDFQFIHVDPERAKLTPFGGPIAHGFLSLSLLPVLTAQADLPRLREKSREALGVMETTLAKRDFLAASGFSIADIALFAYTHEAPAAGIGLEDFPHVSAWLARVRAQPGFVPQ